MNLQQVPTVYPSETEFNELISFLSEPKITRLGNKFGMIKLVPPKSFKPPVSLDKQNFEFQIRRQNLCELQLLNRARLFFTKQLNNLIIASSSKNKKLLKKPYITIPSDTSKNIDKNNKRIYFYDIYIDIIKNYNPNLDSEIFLIYVKISNSKALFIPHLREVQSNSKLWKTLSKRLKVSIPNLKIIFDKYVKEYYVYVQNHYKQVTPSFIHSDNYPKSLLSDEDNTDESDSDEYDEQECLICHNDSKDDLIKCQSCNKYFHVHCINESKIEKSFDTDALSNKRWICQNCILGNGYYGFKIETKDYTLDEFIANTGKLKEDVTIAQLEENFWSNVNNINSRKVVKYGADVHNLKPGQISGFPTLDYIPDFVKDNIKEYSLYAKHPANLVNLPNTKGSLLPLFDDPISGMTIPWLYIGSQYSTFCWHMEDQYTLSANYQHEGSPKIWYSIPPSSCKIFQNFLVNLTPDIFARQPNLMHQLTTLVAPDTLVKEGISCFKVIQNPGEYIITFPRCYHAGFNSGYNLNEAVNFTTNFWLPFGMDAIDDYRISMKQCVFDMYNLLIKILEKYRLGIKTVLDDESLVRSCHNILLKRFNENVRDMSKIRDSLGLLARTIVRIESADTTTSLQDKLQKDKIKYSNDDTDEENDEQVYCSYCKTICSFAFVVHYNPKSSNRKYLQNQPLHDCSSWSTLLAVINDADLHNDFDIVCLQDYLEIFGSNRKNQERTKSDDELCIIRDLTYIEELLSESGDKLDGM